MESFIGLCLLLGLGHLLRMKVRLMQKLYLPSCVIAGLLGLVAIRLAGEARWAATWTAGWDMLPGVLINIVFACLFLGVTLPSLKQLLRTAGPQLAYGQMVAWGQYVVGIGVVLLALTGMLTGLSPAARGMFGGLIPVGFEGGHGTAAGLAGTFADLGWEAGKDLAMASATAGVLSAILVGMILINWAYRKGYVTKRRDATDISADEQAGIIPHLRRPPAGRLTVSSDAIETLTLHLAVIGLAMLFGWAVKEGMMAAVWTLHGELSAEQVKATTLYKMIKPFPTFPLCMIGGLLIQVLEQRFDRHRLIDEAMMTRIQGTALDFLVVAAIATIRVEAVAGLLLPFALLIAAGIGWNVFCVVILARRLLPDAWFERSIAEMGQSMGVTATGLLLLRVVDPDYETPAAEAFAAKQMIHEPFMGGGLWTSTAIPLLALWGGWPVLAIAGGAMVIWLVVLFGSKRHRRA